MTRHLHEPANALLYRALDLPPEERQRFIADTCEGEPELLELARTLLARIDVLDEFLATTLEIPVPVQQRPLVSPLPHVPDVPRLGETVGHWRVLRELGRSGMNAILLVERGEGATRQTGTLKIARAGGQSGDTLARFQQVRQTLSHLNHPAIARPVDAGVTFDGRPYFVVQHSAGTPIDQHCAQAKLDLDGRIALFAQVCHAVHCAHQHLVIHRDLRPANIVIAPDGALEVLNFGIAGDAGESDNAGHSGIPGEPGYWQSSPLFASPEQRAGQPLTTGADIYCLGAVLYALVSGCSPNAAQAAGVIGTLARPAPIRPSEAVTEALERHDPPLQELAADDLLRPSAELARRLRGDLDAIILKAVDPDPARRYASADALAGDLERFLLRVPTAMPAVPSATPAPGDRPDRSRPPHSFMALAAGALVACSLVAVTLAALWHAREADTARAVAEQRSGQPAAPVQIR